MVSNLAVMAMAGDNPVTVHQSRVNSQNLLDPLQLRRRLNTCPILAWNFEGTSLLRKENHRSPKQKRL